MPHAYNASDRHYAGLSPEQRLVVAVLQQALQDAGRQAPTPSPHAQQAREEARRWWQDRAQVQWWLDLIGLPDGTYARLVAGLEEGDARAQPRRR